MLTQQITPQLQQWILSQARAGHGPDAVLQAMLSTGWRKDVALAAIEQSKRGSLVEPPPPTIVPQPALSDSPCVLRTSDREVQVLTTMELPRVAVFANLLSHEECDVLMDLARERLQRSVTLDNWSGRDDVSDWRTSDGMFFTRGENDVVRRLETRIAELLNWPVDHGEPLQLLRYGPGAQYRPHYDYFDPTVPGTNTILGRGGQRVATMLMYLNAPAKGGATIFPDVGLQVTPVRGNAVFFSYDRPHAITRTLHGGAPVIEGEKWVATKWLRTSVFPLDPIRS